MSQIRRKLVIVGDGASGKTSLAILFTTGVPAVKQAYFVTMFENYVADVEVDGKHVELAIWDTPGPEDYDRPRQALSYPDSHVVVICFDIGSPDSLDNVLEKWIVEVNHCCPGIPIILVGSKIELRHDPRTIEELREYHQHPVTYEEGLEVSKRIQAKHYVECSGRTGEGVRDLFQIATREALRPRRKPVKPSKGFSLFKERFKTGAKDIEQDMESQSAPPLDAAEEKELKRLLIAATAAAPQALTKFRLLIIGKTGCGKTTILSKVCGGNMVDRPSTTRGSHNIEKEIEFEGNSKIIAHDSEGFEAGKQNEVDVVRKFIDRKSQERDINQRLHLVWYCMEMNSRPIQQAEKDFFSTPLQVPVVAIVTKFDTFLQDVQQKLEESAEEEDQEVDDDEIEKLAETQADIQFEKHYKGPLNDMKHPPKAVVTLSKVHKSSPDDSRLARLISETLKVLELTETELQSKQRDIYDLSTFFATAQNADTKVKLTISASCVLILLPTLHQHLFTAFPETGNRDKDHSRPMFRGGPFIKTWETYWTHSKSGSQAPVTLVRLLEKHLDNSRHYIGDPKSSDFSEVKDGNPDLLRFCKWEQRVADTTLIMEKVRVFDIKDERTLEALIKWYGQRSGTVTYVRKEVMRLYQQRNSEKYQVPKQWSRSVAQPLVDMVCNRPVEVPG